MKYISTQNHVKTINNMGKMVLRSNQAINAFLENVERTKGYFADIGAAYGHFTFEALQRGGKILAIDLDQRHLDVLLQKCPPVYQPDLEVKCGHFPNSISLPKNTFDGILLSRVLTFLTEEEISQALSNLYQALKRGGSLYITSACPLRKKWEPLKHIYEKQKQENALWPGRIENLWDLVPQEKENLPNQIQLIDVPSLKQGLTQVGFNVERCEYSSLKVSDHDEDLDLTYAIASKPF